MKKRIENIKKQVGEEVKKTSMVILGFVSGVGISKGLDMLSEKFPEAESFVKYAKPIVLGSGGLLITSATDNNEIYAKAFGYGLTVSGAFEGLKLIPFVKEQLTGFEGIATTYYTENDKPPLELGSFGLNALPVKSYSMEDAPTVKINLPDLEGLGYNSDQTDVKGLGYNSSTTEDDIKGII